MTTMHTEHPTSTASGQAPTAGTAAFLLDHEYDGIREYDNPTPGWWHAIFLGTCLFSAVYLVWYHMSPLSTSIHKAWQNQQLSEYKKIFGSLGELKGDLETIQKMRGDAKLMSVAQGLFESNCAACHGRDGGGINGFNLTDDVYKNVKSLPDLFTVVTNGANNGAMPAWSAKLTQNERVLVAAYAANLRGTRPASAKAPDPAEAPVEPWPAK